MFFQMIIVMSIVPLLLHLFVTRIWHLLTVERIQAKLITGSWCDITIRWYKDFFFFKRDWYMFYKHNLFIHIYFCFILFGLLWRMISSISNHCLRELWIKTKSNVLMFSRMERDHNLHVLRNSLYPFSVNENSASSELQGNCKHHNHNLLSFIFSSHVFKALLQPAFIPTSTFSTATKFLMIIVHHHVAAAISRYFSVFLFFFSSFFLSKFYVMLKNYDSVTVTPWS